MWEIAAALRDAGHDAVAAVAGPGQRGASDPELFQRAAADERRIVTENITGFRPLLLQAVTAGGPVAPFVLVPPRRFPRGRGDRTAAIVAALRVWLDRPDAGQRPLEDRLTS